MKLKLFGVEIEFRRETTAERLERVIMARKVDEMFANCCDGPNEVPGVILDGRPRGRKRGKR